MLAFLRTLLAVIVGIFLSFFLIFIFFIIMASAFSTKEVVVKHNSVLVLKLDKEIPERPSDSPLKRFGFFSDLADFPASLKEIVDNIHYAKMDNDIKGIYLETGMINASFPTIEEIRNALIDFKKSGKFVYAYSELYTNKNYYLASVADSIYFNPSGVMGFNGFHSQQVFFKGLLDKLEVEPTLIRATGNKYKSAGEAFTRKDMSDANREQLTQYMTSVYRDFLKKIGDARKINPDELYNIADQFLARYPNDAIKYKLIDKVAYLDQVLTSMKKRLGVDAKKDLNTISIDEYAKAGHRTEPGGMDKIAIIYAVGDITSGEGSETTIGSDKLSEAIRDARLDDNVKAIVLRVNSPGGSALASDIIWREVVMAKKVKPVIASFGDLAASGGYYIAVPANYIFCEPNTITGSIGVFGLLPNMQKFWNDKIGITFDEVKTGKYADLGSITRPLTGEETAIIQGYIDTTYRDFKMKVSEGRHLPEAFVDSIAQGHIYSGIQGKQLGLVDELGNLDDAVAYAAKKANLTKYGVKIMPHYDNFKMSMLLRNLSMSREQILEDELKENYGMFKKIQQLQQMKGIQMYCPYYIDLY